jgi:hypothetical protein
MAATREAATAEGPKAGLWSGVLDMAMSLNGKPQRNQRLTIPPRTLAAV